MTINIELEKLTYNGISLNQYLFMLFIEANDRVGLVDYMKRFRCLTRLDIDDLINNGFMGSRGEKEEKYLLINLYLTDKFSIFATPKIEDWINDWYNLWPQGIKSGGYYVKSDKAGCKNKLLKFIKNNPNYTQDIILEATKNYINEQEQQGFKYMRMAPYFIEKNGMSVLSGYCEAIQQNYTEPTQQSTFIKEI